MRTGISGRSANVPVHAARVSKAVMGVHVDSVLLKVVSSSPASSKSTDQSGGCPLSLDSSTCGGTAMNENKRPAGSRRIEIMPDTSVFVGSSSPTQPKLKSPAAKRIRGLCRYQK